MWTIKVNELLLGIVVFCLCLVVMIGLLISHFAAEFTEAAFKNQGAEYVVVKSESYSLRSSHPCRRGEILVEAIVFNKAGRTADAAACFVFSLKDPRVSWMRFIMNPVPLTIPQERAAADTKSAVFVYMSPTR